MTQNIFSVWTQPFVLKTRLFSQITTVHYPRVGEGSHCFHFERIGDWFLEKPVRPEPAARHQRFTQEVVLAKRVRESLEETPPSSMHHSDTALPAFAKSEHKKNLQLKVENGTSGSRMIILTSHTKSKTPIHPMNMPLRPIQREPPRSPPPSSFSSRREQQM